MDKKRSVPVLAPCRVKPKGENECRWVPVNQSGYIEMCKRKGASR
ncbi:hypothetical protein [Bacillus pseudomycoides]|nr:hypothetical protein [Bacillus pseudomycoides]